jgi:sec-independent protein translocase protein TatB
MFGLGMSELILLGVLALILIGPQQLPEVARTLGRFINDLKRTAEGLTEDIKNQARVDLDLDVMKSLRDDKPSPPIPIMKDPRIKDPAVTDAEAEKKDGTSEAAPIKIEPPDQMTFTFNAELPTDPTKIDSEKKD